MNWILENKNKNSLRGTILQKAKLWRGGISRGKKTKAIVLVLFLACLFLVTVSATHAQNAVPGIEDKAASILAENKDNYFVMGARVILTQIQALMSKLFGIAATLFAVVIAPENISGDNGILNKQAVKDVWIMVRDTLNMFFILVLLFSAFCTIFQVEKWNLKKVWLSILINALLVNFSFPIARIIIDISNVAMYYFVNHMFTSTGTVTGSSIMASFGSATNLGSILAPPNFAGNEITSSIATIIFMFILGMTLLIIAVLFTIRLLALTLIIMFSPIGFVGFIFPATADFANKWWKQLFSYSFFAPIMIFGMAVALKVAEQINAENAASFTANAYINTTPPTDANWIAKTAFFAIPIVILWVVMGVAKSMGIAGADKVVETGKKWGKSLAMLPAKGIWGATKWGANATGVPGGVKKGWEDVRKSGKIFGMENRLLKDGKAERESKLAGFFKGGQQGYGDAEREFIRKEANELRENWKKAGGASEEELSKSLNGKNKAAQLAAAMEAAEKNGFNDTTPGARDALQKYQAAAKAVKNDPVFKNLFEDKVKEKHVRFMIKDEIATNTNPTISAASIYKKHLDKMNPEKLAKQRDIFEDVEAKDYMKNKTDKKFVRKVAEKISQKDRDALKAHGVGI